MTLRAEYPGIARACRLISLDNGGINRFRSERQMLAEMEAWLARQVMDLKPIDTWLARLSDEDLEEVCCGGAGEPRQVELLEQAPPFTDSLLNDFFDEVC